MLAAGTTSWRENIEALNVYIAEEKKKANAEKKKADIEEEKNAVKWRTQQLNLYIDAEKKKAAEKNAVKWRTKQLNLYIDAEKKKAAEKNAVKWRTKQLNLCCEETRGRGSGEQEEAARMLAAGTTSWRENIQALNVYIAEEKKKISRPEQKKEKWAAGWRKERGRPWR